MNKNLLKRILVAFKLPLDGEDEQKNAVLERKHNVVVTAGAGSGKTSTLVARYVTLLVDGYNIRRIVAITFTEKAAREMRSRIRETLDQLLRESIIDEERDLLADWNSQIDAARISTIHSLCAEILRAHPAEAGIDPKFKVLDEGLSAALRAQCVRDVMSEMADKTEYGPVFNQMDINSLTNLLAYLLDRRLQADEILSEDLEHNEVIREELRNVIKLPEIAVKIQILRQASLSDLKADAGDKFADQIQEFLSLWSQAEIALNSNEFMPFCEYLNRARRTCMDLRGGKRSGSYYKDEIFHPLRDSFDKILGPVCGLKEEEVPSKETEQAFFELLSLIRSAYKMLIQVYEKALQDRSALDFDDLEGRAVSLLQQLEIQAKWQSEIDALLVDEFQDTNQRQRDIVEALTNSPGKLFIVGDAKQSIYRFRQADVTVFRSIRKEIKQKGGVPIRMQKTFRSHEALLAGMNDLLCGVMGDKEDPSRPFFEPFSAMIAHRKVSKKHIQSPHIEFVLGGGEKSANARTIAALALTCRLLELKNEGQIKDWDEVVLLFRSANGFKYYEDAFEETNIPFVTVAGKGFYERPEIRDVLNILRALTDPTDDLAMAGLLRSPAFGLTDAALYQMRWMGDKVVHYWAALNSPDAVPDEEDRLRAQRSLTILNELMPLVDRVPVTELLNKFIDLTDYRSVFAIDNKIGGGARLWRNLDKLILDARASGMISVRDFLEYLKTIEATGVREGEAPAQAQGSVRLMTIHKAKGLQFPIVVLADAGRTPRSGGESVYLLPVLGLSFKLDPEPLIYRLSKLNDKRQSDAEEQRILYVALTRAQEKLMISGHAKFNKQHELSASGWLDELTSLANLNMDEVIDHSGEEIISQTVNGHEVRGWTIAPDIEISRYEFSGDNSDKLGQAQKDIFAPLAIPVIQEVDEREMRPTQIREFLKPKGNIPGTVLGSMVHKAIELWLFPNNPGLHNLLENMAVNEGIAQKVVRDAAVSEATELLSRLFNHPVYKEINEVEEKFHEVPFSVIVSGYPKTGYIDLLYRSKDTWKLIDFKTDAIQSEKQKNQLIEEYSCQIRQYKEVLREIQGIDSTASICFLDNQGKIDFVNIT